MSSHPKLNSLFSLVRLIAFLFDKHFSFYINSRLSRLNTARGSGTDLVTVGPAKVKACTSLLFNERCLSS